MLNHEQLMESWSVDSKIDKSDLKNVLYNHPMLHSKYLTMLMDYKSQLHKHVLKYQKTKVFYQRYYNGELTKDELTLGGLSQYLFKKPLRAEMESLLDGTPALQLIQEQSVYLEGLINATESIMKDISSRYFLFKTIVDYEKYLTGA